MTRRQLALVFGTAGLLLVAWLILREGPDGGDGGDLDLAALVDGGAGFVRIEPADGRPIELERRGTGWTVNGYPALDSLVDATLAALDTVRPGRLVARSEATHERLELTDDRATRVRLGPPGAESADFLVGGVGTDGRFVRLAGETPSYVVDSAAVGPLAAPEAAWRDFTIARVDTAGLRRVAIRRADGRGAVVERMSPGESAWTVDGAAADSAVMNRYLGLVSDLQATGFPADSFVFAADFERPVATVELFGDDERVPEVALLFSTGLDHPDALVRRADDPIVYALDRPRANLLTTAAERFLRR